MAGEFSDGDKGLEKERIGVAVAFQVGIFEVEGIGEQVAGIPVVVGVGIGSGEVGDVLAEVNFFGEFLAVGGIIPGLDGDDFIELRGIGRRFGVGLEIVGDLATELRESVFDFLG